VADGSSLAISHTGRNDPEKPPVAGGGRRRRSGCRAGVVAGGGRPESLSMRGSCKFLYRVYGRGNAPLASDPATLRGGNGGNGGKHPARPLLVRLRISPLCHCVATEWGKFPPECSKMRREISPVFPLQTPVPLLLARKGAPAPPPPRSASRVAVAPPKQADWKVVSDGRRRAFPACVQTSAPKESRTRWASAYFPHLGPESALAVDVISHRPEMVCITGIM
jgi:hypothetical protein